jgi:NAD+ diphosphatase
MTSMAGHQLSPGPRPPFAGASLDRATEVREDPAQVARLLKARGAAVLAAGAAGVLLERSARRALARRPLVGSAADLVDPTAPILLGIEDGTALFATDLDGLTEPARESLLATGELVSLRDAGALLDQAEGGLAAYLMALLNWHRRHGFCANCGAPTTVSAAGLSRRCESCGSSHFPRTDPVVIMRVACNGHVLLGSRAGWPGNRYSILAGFVEPGETPEEAVIREVREESGIAAHALRYVTSQPWPFPSSLMIGFEALGDGGEPACSDGELSDIGWFTREQVRRAQSGQGEIQLPPPISIARILIDRWVDSEM